VKESLSPLLDLGSVAGDGIVTRLGIDINVMVEEQDRASAITSRESQSSLRDVELKTVQPYETVCLAASAKYRSSQNRDLYCLN